MASLSLSLETAHALFYRDGIRATGVDRVIADAGVTKVTFYRAFPSKNQLIEAYLALRHERWMAWFTDALHRHRRHGVGALRRALAEWFRDDDFRGCAFLNGVSELPTQPEVVEATRRHKAAMTAAIATILPATQRRAAAALALAVDGAIVQAQSAASPAATVKQLTWIIERICGGPRIAQ